MREIKEITIELVLRGDEDEEEYQKLVKQKNLREEFAKLFVEYLQSIQGDENNGR